MELTIEKIVPEMDCIYIKNMSQRFIMRETDGPDYRSALVLLRNLGEKKETTSLEREALSSAVRLLKQKMDENSRDGVTGVGTS